MAMAFQEMDLIRTPEELQQRAVASNNKRASLWDMAEGPRAAAAKKINKPAPSRKKPP
jgi:hypothetical protein